MISDVAPDLRQIIQTLRDGNLEIAKGRTADLIESANRMSGPMYREERVRPGPPQDHPVYQTAAAKLSTLTQNLREVSFTMRRGTPVNALQLAERALSVFLESEGVARK
jgi:hypothetical protein